jgi:hypothetical protein
MTTETTNPLRETAHEIVAEQTALIRPVDLAVLASRAAALVECGADGDLLLREALALPEWMDDCDAAYVAALVVLATV